MTTRYTADIDLEAANTSQALAVLSVQPGSLVLDIGAADGSVAQRLAERGCRVIAVEIDSKAARAADEVCERVVVADVEQLDLVATFESVEFDAVLLLDVLEHLRDPLSTLRAAAAQCKPGGRIVVSVPNVTHAAMRLQLLAGRFPYTDCGLLDRTHLHFFDRSGLERLLAGAGLSVTERMRTSAGLTETEIPIEPDEFPEQVVSLALNDPDAETYQFVYVATPMPSPTVPGETASLGETLQRRARQAERVRAEAEGYARSLEVRVGELELERQRLATKEAQERDRVAELERELRIRMQELDQKHTELEYAKRGMAMKDAQLVHLHAELAPLRARLDQLEHMLGSTRRFMIGRIGSVTRRVPILHRALKRASARVADRR